MKRKEQEKEKKYVLEYTSIPTGYGWQREYDRLEDFEDFIDEMRHEYTASVRLWDNEIKNFVFWKDGFKYEPRIDILHDSFRDMRTTTRRRKM